MANETKIIISAATAQAESALRTLGSSVDGVSRKMFDLSGVASTLTGALSITAFAGFIKQSIDAADQLNDLAQKTGTSVEALAGLKFAADQNGTSLEAVANASKKLSTVMADKPELLKKFGVTAKDTTGALVQLADIFAAMPDGAEKSALAVKLLGKSGEEMIPFLNQGSAALRATADEGARLNPITAEMAKQADQFKDDLARLSAQFSGLGIAIAKDSLRPLTKIAEAMAEAARNGGLLDAAMVGLASTWNALFTDDMLSRSQKIVKQLDELRRAMDAPNVSAQGRNAINKRMLALQAEMESLQPKAPQVPAKPKDDKRGKALYDALGGDGKKTDPFKLENEAWVREKEAQVAAMKRQNDEIDQSNAELQRSALEAQRIIFDIDPIAKMQAEWEKLLALKEQGLLTDEQAGKAYQKTFEGIDKSGNDAFKSLEAAVRGWGNAFTDEMTKMVRTGKLNFSTLADSIINDLIRIQIQKNVTDPLIKMGTDFLGGLFGGTPTPNANGGVYGGAGISAYSGSVVSRPTLFPFARGVGLMGEAGPEAILPLTRVNGKLGVQAQGGGAPNMVINMVNQSGQNLNARQQGGPQFDGRSWVLGIVLEAADSDPHFRNALGVGAR